MALGTNDMTTTTGAKFIPAIWSKLVQKALEHNLVAANLVLRLDSDAQQPGNVIHIPQVSNLSANAKATGSQVTLQSPTESEVTPINLNKHYEASFLVEDDLAVQSKYALPAFYLEKAGYAIALQIDTDVLGLYTGFSNNVGNSTSNVSDTNVLSAISTLDQNDIPADDRAFIFYTSQRTALLGIDKFVFFTPEANNGGVSVGNGPIKTGRVGDLYGIPTYFSNNVPITSSTFVHNMLIHKEAVALGLQFGPRIQSQYKLEYLGQLYVTDVMYGVGTYRAAAGVEFRTQK